MGWRFARSINFGPLRITFSKTGVGWSIGSKGFRTGVDSKGRKYNSISVPGTGISKRTYENNNPQQNAQQSSGNKEISWPIMVGIFIALYALKAILK